MQQIIEYITLGIASMAGLIIIYGILLGTVDFFRVELRRFKNGEEKSTAFEKIRYDLGFHLLLGLEFFIAADIVRTVIRPTLEELAILGGTVTIRTVLGYFLGREIGRPQIK